MDWNKQKTPVRCDECFNKHVRERLIHLVHENRPSGEKARVDACRERDENGRKKRVVRKSCKHCGATSHVSRNSKKCPHFQPRKRKRKTNKDNKQSESSKSPVAGAGAAAPVNTPAAAPVNTPAAPPAYAVGDNCLARWKRRQFYRAQITHIIEGRYTVYFLDGNVKKNLRPKDIRSDDGGSFRRGDLIGKIWYYDGEQDLAAGFWKVRRVENNAYVCLRMSGEGKNSESFDIGYVIRQYQKELDKQREAGPRYKNKKKSALEKKVDEQ